MRLRSSPPVVHDCACGDHSWSPLTRGFVTLVSPGDRHLLEASHWMAGTNPQRQFYARRARRVGETCFSTGQTIHLHREVLRAVSGDVDHRDRNTLDNRRGNLRAATRSENCRNSARKNSSGYKGVQKKRERNHRVGYQARIADPERRYLGWFKTPEEAARAYDKAALAYFGPFARLNFPHEHSVIDGGAA